MCSSDLGSNGTIWVQLGQDTEHSCRAQWVVEILCQYAGLDVRFKKDNLLNCYAEVTLEPTFLQSEQCDITDIQVTVTPFGDWLKDDLVLATCLPPLAKSFPSLFPSNTPITESSGLGFDEVCPICTAGAGTGAFLKASVPCSDCGGNIGVSPVNGSVSVALRVPASDTMAPRETLTYNSAPLFGPDSPYADAIMESPPAGAHMSGVLSMRLIPDVQGGAAAVRCDGSLDVYSCKDDTTHIYVPIGHRNVLTENVDVSNTRIGFTEDIVSNGFQYKYSATGALTYLRNPAGQRWTFVRDGGLAKAIVDPYSRRLSYS